MEKHNFDLSKNQAKKLMSAVKTKKPISFKFTNAQLINGRGIKLPVSKQDYKKINAAKRKNTGVVVRFSEPELISMEKEGGILPALAALIPVAVALLSGAAGAAGTWGANKLLKKVDEAIEKKQKGNALFPPGFTGQTGNALFPMGVRPKGRGLKL